MPSFRYANDSRSLLAIDFSDVDVTLWYFFLALTLFVFAQAPELDPHRLFRCLRHALWLPLTPAPGKKKIWKVLVILNLHGKCTMELNVWAFWGGRMTPELPILMPSKTSCGIRKSTGCPQNTFLLWSTSSCSTSLSSGKKKVKQKGLGAHRTHFFSEAPRPAAYTEPYTV